MRTAVGRRSVALPVECPVTSLRLVGGSPVARGVAQRRRLVRMVAAITVGLLALESSRASDWMVETIPASENVGYWVNIDVRDPGLVHLCYDNQWPTYEAYAERDTSGWTSWDMQSYFSACGLAVDPSNRARLLTTDRPSTTYTLTYWQQQDTGNWWYWPDLATNNSAGNAELKVNSSGTAMLGYLDRTTPRLMYGEIQGDLWGSPSYHTEVVASGSVFDTAQPLVEMILDHNEQPCFLWYESTGQTLKWARRGTGGTWSVQTIRSGPMYMGFTAAFDASNDLHLAFTGSTGGDIRHGVYNGTGWQEQQVDSSGDRVGSLVIDSQDQPHLAYLTFPGGAVVNDQVKYATFYGNQWHTETVAELASAGNGLEEVVMDVDSADHLHMAYRGDADALWYARLDQVPRPVPTVTVNVPPTLDAQATYSSSVGFIISDGAWGIDVDKIPSSGTDRRGVLEFDFGPLHPGVDVVSAQLQLDVSMIVTSGSNGPTPSVYAFAGDGQILPSDATKTQTLVGVSEPILDGGTRLIDLDPLAIQSLLRQNSYLGLLLVGTTYGMSFYTLEWPYPSLGSEAVLILELTPEPLPGDANKDGVVNNQDAQILAANWGLANRGWGGGDFNGDGTVNAADASILAANWLATAEECLATVPEPSATALLAAVAALALGLRRREANSTLSLIPNP